MKKLLLVLFIILGTVQVYSQNRRIDINEKDSEETNLKLRGDIQKFQDISSRSRQFVLNKVLQNEYSVALQDTLVLSLFSDKNYKAYIDAVEKDINGVVSIRARFVDYPMGYGIITTSPDNKSLMIVEIPELDEKYVTRIDSDTKSNYLIEVDKQKAIALEGGDPLTPSVESIKNEDTTGILPRSTAPASIDIMIVYTPAAKAWSESEGGINNTIASIMSKSKLVLDNSNVQITLNLVHSQEVNYTESGSSNTDLSRITNVSDGYLDEVHQWRDQYNADLVVFLTKVEDTGGLAWRLNNTSGSPGYGFSISRIQQASWTTTAIHEIGHNMGLGHHKQQTTQAGPGIFSYSAGWRWRGNDNVMYCSVMTYDSGSYFADGISAREVPYFANPSLSYAGYPTGHATEADAARSLRETKHIIAGYRVRSGECNTPTGLSASNIAGNSATLRWNTVTGAQSYTVEYKTSTTTAWRVATSSNTGTSYNLTGLTSGTTYNWRVKTNCSSTNSSAYAQSSFTTTVVSACVNNYEPNETLSAARAISTNVVYNAGIGSSTDQDYYKFTINGTNNVVITLQNLPKDYDLELLNSSGTVLSRSSAGGTSNETITYNNLAAGTYYIRVYGYSGNFDLNTCYALKVAATAVTSACVNNYEPNETLSAARAISTNITYNAGIGSSTDKDYYKFTINTVSNIVVTLQNLPKDYDLQLLNSSGTVLGRSSYGGTSNETITLNNLAAGTYYVYVYGYSGNFDLSTCYALRVSSTTASSDEVTGIESINSDISSAINLYPNPVEDILYVKGMTLNSKGSTVSIIDVSGRRIKDVMVNSEEEVRVDVSELSPGLYYLNISGKGYKFIKK